MEHTLVRLLMGGVVEAFYQITITRILTIRHKAAYHAIKSIDYIAAMALSDLGMLPTSARIVMSVVFSLALPIMMSSGDPRRRILRVLLIEAELFLIESMGTVIYIAFFSKSPDGIQYIGQESIESMLTVYIILSVMAAALFELTVFACNRLDKVDYQGFSMPIIWLIFGAVVLTIITYMRLLGDARLRLQSHACALLSFVGVFLVFLIAKRDAASQREAADSALAARKARHTVMEVQAMSWRAKGLAALRHTLANDAREIPRLAGSGQADEAACELSNLVEQAHILNGGTNE